MAGKGRKGTGGWALALMCLAFGAAAMPPEPPWLQQAQAMLAREPQAALAMADNAVTAAEQIGDRRTAFVAHFGRAGLHRAQGQYGEAVLDFERALADAEALSSPTWIAETQHALGVAFSLSGLNVEAMEAFQQALLRQVELGNWARASAALTNIGNVLADRGDIAGARDHYERALAMKREHGIDAGVGILLNNLGDLDRESGDLDAARQQLSAAIELHQAAGAHGHESTARSNLALVLAQQGDFQAALHQIEVAEQRAAGGETRLLATALAGRAETYLRMARAEPDDPVLREQRLERALDAIERARAIADAIDDPGRLAQVAALQSEVRAERGELADALALLRAAGEFRREQDRRADSGRLAVLAARFRDAQQRGEIARLHERELRQRSELQQQRGLALLLGISALALAAVASLLLRQVRQRRRHAAEQTARNVALGDALLEAEEQRERAERLSQLNLRLLALAGDDLRGPLLRIRSLSERLLVDRRGDAALERQIAAIAQAAGELIRVADQITESAALVDGSEGRASGCNVLALLRELVDQVDVRVPGRERRLQLAGDSRAIVRVETRRLDRVLHELIDAVLQHNSGGERIAVDLQRSGEWVELRIDDPSGEVLQRIGAGGGSVGLAFARGVIRELGGDLVAETQSRPPTLLVKMPRA